MTDDRAAGWIRPPQDQAYLQGLIEERDVWSAEVDRQAEEIERLQAEIESLTERVGWEEHLLERAGRAEARLTKVRGLTSIGAQGGTINGRGFIYQSDLHAALDGDD